MSCFRSSANNIFDIFSLLFPQEEVCPGDATFFGKKIIPGVRCVYHPEMGFIWCGGLAGTGHTQIYIHTYK